MTDEKFGEHGEISDIPPPINLKAKRAKLRLAQAAETDNFEAAEAAFKDWRSAENDGLEVEPLQKAGSDLEGVFALITRRSEKLEKPVPLPFRSYEECVRGSGLWPGLETVVGLTGSLKSQFGVQKVVHAAQSGVPTLVITLELTALQMRLRILCHLAGVSWSKCEVGEANAADIARLEAARPDFDALPIHVDRLEPQTSTVADVDQLCARFRAQYPSIGVLCAALDFVQLVGAENPRAEARERVGSVMYGLQKVAFRHSVAMSVVSSTARANYGSLADIVPQAKLYIDHHGNHIVGNPAAILAVAKESGEAEYASEGLLVLSRYPAKLDNGETLILGLQGKYRFAECRWFAMAASHGRLREYPVTSMDDLPEVERKKGGKTPVAEDEYEARVLAYAVQHPGEVRSVTGFRGKVPGRKEQIDAAAKRLADRHALSFAPLPHFPVAPDSAPFPPASPHCPIAPLPQVPPTLMAARKPSGPRVRMPPTMGQGAANEASIMLPHCSGQPLGQPAEPRTGPGTP